MNDLMKVLVDDEKKIDVLTVQYNLLRKNIVNETATDSEKRIALISLIKKMKKSNAVIVDHCLGERKLTLPEIESIVKTHITQ
jgi:hypothetical protein